jgi:hypothetical protein
VQERILPNWLKAYMEYSQHSEAPDKFHFWTGVSTIAGALRRRVWIDQGYFQWTPNFYIIFVAPPGIVSKSTTLGIGMKLLKDLPGIKFGPDAVTWQALTQSLAESTEAVLMPDEMWHNMSCVTIASSEFGTFLNPNDREMVDVLVSLWDGQLGVWEKRTKTQGSDRIENPWINIAACTTPAWIAGNFPDYLIGGGFTSRCVWVYAERKRKLVAYPSDVLPPEFRQMEEILKRDLEAISMMAGEYRLTPEATAFGIKWYEEHYTSAKNKELDNDRFAGYLARKQTHIHKLAMVLAASESSRLFIDASHLSAATEIVTALETDMPRVFSNIGLQGATKHAHDILGIIKAYGQIEKSRLLRTVLQHMSGQEFAEAIQSLVAAHLVRVEQRGNEIWVTHAPQAT